MKQSCGIHENCPGHKMVMKTQCKKVVGVRVCADAPVHVPGKKNKRVGHSGLPSDAYVEAQLKAIVNKLASANTYGDRESPAQTGCTLYQHANYKGWSVKIPANGSYRRFAKPKHNDHVSSVRVSGGCVLALYEHWDFRGVRHTYSRARRQVRTNDKYSSAKCACR